MRRRRNGILTTGTTATSLAFVGVAGWVAFRIYLRQRTMEELEKEGLLAGGGIAQGVAGAFGLTLNLPPATTLARSMLPIWSTNTPYEAMDDILKNGRESEYWPEDYRQGGTLAAMGLEDELFRLASKYQSPE